MTSQQESNGFLIKIENKHPKNYFLLSEYDEFVPNTHIGITALTRNYDNKGAYMGKAALERMRANTFQSVYSLFRQCGSISFAEFFNSNLEDLCDLGLIHFEDNRALSQVVNLIECFETLRKTPPKSYVISFGINRKDLREYLSLQKSGATIPERLKHSKYYLKKPTEREKMLQRFGGYWIQSSHNGGFPLCNNAILRRYQAWCKLNGITLEDGLLFAMERTVNEYGEKKPEELEKYDKKTPFDYLLLKHPKKEAECVSIEVQFDGTLFAIANAIIDRMNRDPRNLLHPIDFQLYINNALLALNKKMPLKYRDPNLYLEYGEYQKMEKEASIIANNKRKEGKKNV